MKKVLIISVLMMTALSARADKLVASCTQNNSRIDVVSGAGGLVASYYNTNNKIADANNVIESKNADGSVLYATDMGFALKVNGKFGSFEGIWPSPMNIVNLTSMICTN